MRPRPIGSRSDRAAAFLLNLIFADLRACEPRGEPVTLTLELDGQPTNLREYSELHFQAGHLRVRNV